MNVIVSNRQGNAQLAVQLAQRACQMRASANGPLSEPYALALVNLSQVRHQGWVCGVDVLCMSLLTHTTTVALTRQIYKLAGMKGPAYATLQQAEPVLRRLPTPSSADTLASCLSNLGELQLHSGRPCGTLTEVYMNSI